MIRRLLSATLLVATTVAWLAGSPHHVGAYSGTPPARRTGAPGESNCSSCHNGPLNDGVGSVTVTGAPALFTPGQVYPITVTVSRSGQTRWGFELVVLRKADNTQAGTLANTSQLTTTQTSSGKTYVSHTTIYGPDGTYAGSAGPRSWTFDWTAPAAGADTVVFYAVGLAADNDGSDNSGDRAYTTQVVVKENAVTPARPVTWGEIKHRYR